MNEKYLYMCENYHRVVLAYRKDKGVHSYRVVVEDSNGKAISVATGTSADLAICLAYYRLPEFKDL